MPTKGSILRQEPKAISVCSPVSTLSHSGPGCHCRDVDEGYRKLRGALHIPRSEYSLPETPENIKTKHSRLRTKKN